MTNNLQELLQKYLQAFKRLRIDRAHGVAPHKPVMLIAVLQTFQNGINNNTCCISGMKIDATINVSMIDACHIVPFSISYDDTVTNGIALCPNLHRAFDRGLLGIDENYRVVVSNTFREDETSYSIRAFEGKAIRLPTIESYFPTANNFLWHLKNIFKKCKHLN